MSRHRSLDGIRAVALVLVVAYHLDIPGMRGGFVGVDLFFVLSGYLITSLLIDEQRRTGSVSLRAFWMRRIRRLWPLAWITFLLVAIAGAIGIWSADQQSTLTGQTLAAVGQVENWWQIAHGGYVERFSAPSPLRHVWSLSVEEQFYFIWPVLLAGVLGLVARSGRFRHGLWVMVGGLSLASIGLGFLVDPTRAYLSTGTRAVALLAGSALAIAWSRHPLAGPGAEGLSRSRVSRRLLGAAGVTGTAFLALVVVVGRPDAAWLGRGGFALIALAGTAMIAASIGGPFAARDGLALAPVVWVGERSYAVYLLHWPIIVALGPTVALWIKVLVTLVVSFAGAEVLRRLVELPMTVGRAPARPALLAGVGIAAVTVVALLVAQPSGTTPTQQVAASLEAVPDPVVAPVNMGPSSTGSSSTGPSSTSSSTAAAEPAQPGSAAPQTTPPSIPTTAPPTSRRESAGTTSTPPTTRRPVAPPTTCPPTTAPPTTFGGSQGFDMATIDEVGDPGGNNCGVATKVMVLGDSTGRGISNGLAALADSRLQVWDRTVLGCAFNQWNYGKKCPSWRDAWSISALGVKPDVVVIYTTVAEELQGGKAQDFLSAGARAERVGVLTEAVRLLSATGAQVVLTTTAVPLRPNGLFYCRMKQTDSRCDPSWVAEWNRSLLQTSASTGAKVLDASGWIDARGASASRDRPDGLHLSGSALVEHSRWLVPQLLSAARQ